LLPLAVDDRLDVVEQALGNLVRSTQRVSSHRQTSFPEAYLPTETDGNRICLRCRDNRRRAPPEHAPCVEPSVRAAVPGEVGRALELAGAARLPLLPVGGRLHDGAGAGE